MLVKLNPIWKLFTVITEYVKNVARFPKTVSRNYLSNCQKPASPSVSGNTNVAFDPAFVTRFSSNKLLFFAIKNANVWVCLVYPQFTQSTCFVYLCPRKNLPREVQ